MKNNMYCVHDNLTNTWLAPVIMRTDEEALRMFKSQVNSLELWKQNPGDFELYRVGTFDDESGEIAKDLEKIVGGRSVLDG